MINEGVKQKVWKTAFIGNTIASDDRLRTQISSKSPFLYLFGGEFDRKKAAEDVDKLTAYYRGLGYFRARVGTPMLEYNDKENWVTITFVIDEGPRYQLRNISVIGNKKYSTDELMGELKLKNNEYYNKAKVLVDQSALKDKYGSVGYVFADIQPDLRFLENTRPTRPGVYHQGRRPLPRRQDQRPNQGRVSAHAHHHGAEPPIAHAGRSRSTFAKFAPASGG